MADDLASRIADASVAALDLVPGEQRFAALSQHVLRGGASRFAPVVLADEGIRYVVPVGVPGATLVYGTLLIQKSRVALVWRPDPGRPYLAQTMPLGPETAVTQSPVSIRDEVWGRFDLRRPGSPDVTFLVPPVASVALPRMLYRVLIEEPGSQQSRTPGAPLPTTLTDTPDADDGGAPTEALHPDDLPVAASWTPRRPVDPTEPLIDDSLYRPTSRVSPEAVPVLEAPPEPIAQATIAPVTVALPVERPPGAGDLLKGFLTGLVATLIVGGLYIAARVLGWL